MKKISLTKKQIGLTIYFIVGTIIIIAAISSIKTLFFSDAVKQNAFTTSFEDFYEAYSINSNYNDLPPGLEMISSVCNISDDNQTFTYYLTVKNSSGVDKKIAYQFFFGPEHISKYATKTQNPFMSCVEENAVYLLDDQEYTIEYTSMIIGSTDEEIEAFKESLNRNLYFESSLGSEVTRVQMPMNFE